MRLARFLSGVVRTAAAVTSGGIDDASISEVVGKRQCRSIHIDYRTDALYQTPTIEHDGLIRAGVGRENVRQGERRGGGTADQLAVERPLAMEVGSDGIHR